MKLIVGLGNPDRKYDGTYHNTGFMAVDMFAKKHNAEFTKKKCNALFATCEVDGETIILAKPLTYMNLSGQSVLGLKRKYKLENKDIFVFVDDIDLPIGTYRFREKGSGGTHNGMRNIVEMIGQDFPRMRIGIGKPEDCALIDFVLQRIKGEKLEKIMQAIDEATDKIVEKLK